MFYFNAYHLILLNKIKTKIKKNIKKIKKDAN